MGRPSFYLLITLIVATAASIPALSARPDLSELPADISKKCGTPVGWVTVDGDHEIQLNLVPPNGGFEKIACIMRELQTHPDVSIGFVGNEADPNQVLPVAWSYIAGGTLDALTALSVEVKKAGWVAGSFAKADDGTGFLLFHTPAGMTAGQASIFATRIWKHQLGRITFGKPPTSDGDSFNDQ